MSGLALRFDYNFDQNMDLIFEKRVLNTEEVKNLKAQKESLEAKRTCILVAVGAVALGALAACAASFPAAGAVTILFIAVPLAVHAHRENLAEQAKLVSLHENAMQDEAKIYNAIALVFDRALEGTHNKIAECWNEGSAVELGEIPSDQILSTAKKDFDELVEECREGLSWTLKDEVFTYEKLKKYASKGLPESTDKHIENFRNTVKKFQEFTHYDHMHSISGCGRKFKSKMEGRCYRNGSFFIILTLKTYKNINTIAE